MNPIITLICEHLVTFYIGIAVGFIACFILSAVFVLYRLLNNYLFCKDNELPYDEGYDMRLAGIEPEGNPYDIYTEEHGEWERGYVHAGIDQDRE